MLESLQLLKELRTLDKSEDPADVRRREVIVARLVELHRGLVVSIASRMLAQLRLRSDELDDLIGEGNIALLKAIHRFDPSQQVPFSAYATRLIEGVIHHYARDKASTIREPAWVYEARDKAAAPAVVAASVGLPGQAGADGQVSPLDVSDEGADFSRASDAKLTLEAFFGYKTKRASDTGAAAVRFWKDQRACLELHFQGVSTIDLSRRLDIKYHRACYLINEGLNDLRKFADK